MTQSRGDRSKRRTLKFIKDYINENGIPPSRREIMVGAGFSTTSSATYHVKALEDEGKIKIIPNIARGIVVIHEEEG